MSARKILPLLVTSFILTLGGAVLAGGTPVSETVQGMDFNPADGVFVGFHATPNGRALGFYQHTEHTNHGIGNPGAKDHPPSPCFGLTHAWNASLRQGESARNRGIILQRLAEKQCYFSTDVSVDNTDPQNPIYTLDSITPNQP
jgi:hypothetical protein